MALRLADKWVWDFWLAPAGGLHHVFYLQAPRALGDPELRHHNATIGHAVSTDLTDWEVLPDALHPGPSGSWDDLATWTGSIIEHDGRWYMLYTGVNQAEDGLIQRIGLAVSDDLVQWHKHPDNPVLEADPRWYEQLDLSRWRDQSWRDPWLFRDAGDGSFHALITARSPHGSPDGAGVVAHARSRDLLAWEVGPPLTSAGDFAQVEVPQLVRVEGRYSILISCLAEDHSEERLDRLGVPAETGTFVYSAAEPFGPYLVGERPLLGSDTPLGLVYSGKLIEISPGDWRFIGFRGGREDDFAGELTDPLPVRLDAQGGIVVDEAITLGERDGIA